MPDLKPLSKDAIPGALEKARHYRLLNQPWQAESICRDILEIDPGNQEVIYTLILAITDQFGDFKKNISSALDLVSRLDDQYQSEYISGLVYERNAAAALKRNTPRAVYMAYESIDRAMEHYENAEQIRPSSNEESILRWNACVRYIEQHNLRPAPDTEDSEPFLDV